MDVARKFRCPVLLIALGAVLAPAMAIPAPQKPAPTTAVVDPLVPAAPSSPQSTNLSMLPAPATRTLPAPGDPEFEFGGPLRKSNPKGPPQSSPEPTNTPTAPPVGPAPAPPSAQASPETDWITPDECPDPPVIVRVNPPPDSVMVPGIIVRQMRVDIRNRSTDRAAAIRDVHWINGLRRSDWVKSLSGKSRVTAAGLVVIERGPDASDIWFEHGLLLPGESMKLTLPLTPQSPGIHVLEVSFVAVGGADKPWRDQVLIPASRGNATEIFDAPADRSIQDRAGQGGIGLLRCALQNDGPTPEVTRLAYRVGLPLIQGEWLPQLTAGLAADKAVSIAGLPLQQEGSHLAYFLEPLQAWVLVRPADGESRVLLRDGENWTVLKGCRMDVAAPDLMCAAPDLSTPALLDPNAFADIAKVQTPWLGKLYNPGKTYLNPETLRAVLRRATERRTPIRVATIDPNGLGLEEILTIGVKVDAAGRWLSPSIGATTRATPADTPKADFPPRTSAPIAGSPPSPH